MYEEGYITREEMRQSNTETIPQSKSFVTSAKAAYFIEYIRKYLEESMEKRQSTRED